RFCRRRDKGIGKMLADAAIGEPAGDIRMIDSTYQGTRGRMRGTRRQSGYQPHKKGAEQQITLGS
ncbi:hypothetical protein, partial [Treponema endosymbiont of Eucomonympha sp.]